VPGRFAIAAFSPRLNEAGNSVRAQLAIRYIAGKLGVGIFGPNPGGASVENAEGDRR
jgi:glutaminase